MRSKTLGFLSLYLLLSTILFLVLFTIDMAGASQMDLFEQVLDRVAKQSILSRLAYANVTLLTIVTTMLMAGLYVFTKRLAPVWATIGLVFTPVYCVLNLFAYFSQITIVPRLLELRQLPQYQTAAEFLLRQLIQTWPASAVSIFNNTAYGILGIPSIIFGVLLYRIHPTFRVGAVLLAINGVMCITGVIGFVLNNQILMWGSMAGAVFYLLALIPLSLAFLRKDPAHV